MTPPSIRPYSVRFTATLCMGPHHGAKRTREVETSADSAEGAKQKVRDMLTSCGHRDVVILECQPTRR